MRRWLLIGLIGLAGCTTLTPPPTLTVAEQQRDIVACKAQAEQAAGPEGSLFRGSVVNRYYVMCLEGRAWLASR